MKKIEKLTGSKFKAFKSDKISNLAKLVGGTIINTSCSIGGAIHTDTIDNTTNNGWTFNGSPCDFMSYSALSHEGQPLGNVISVQQQVIAVYTPA